LLVAACDINILAISLVSFILPAFKATAGLTSLAHKAKLTEYQ